MEGREEFTEEENSAEETYPWESFSMGNSPRKRVFSGDFFFSRGLSVLQLKFFGGGGGDHHLAEGYYPKY